MTAAERDPREESLQDPLTSSGGLHEAGRLRRGVAEFLRLPLLITLGFGAAGVLLAVLDAMAPERAPLRRAIARIVPDDTAVDFVAAVATSVVTVTSITFSVLLIAVQQTATSLTAVVFDQFLRRTSNQVYFGFFIGLSTFCFIILGAARGDPGPVYGASVTLLLTVVALVMLLLLIHGTIDQMRPQSVVRSIHELALQARERELVMLGRTRATRTTDPSVPERAVTVPDNGYVVSVDEDWLARIAARAGPDVEVIVEGTLGEYLMFGDVIVRLANVAPDDASWDRAVRLAFGLDDIRDVEAESGYAIAQLEDIGWASCSSAQQSPQTAMTAARALHDLLARWLVAGERDRSDRSDTPEDLPVVYPDDTVARVLNSLCTIVVATAESRQVHTCAVVLRALASVAPRIEQDAERRMFQDALRQILPAVVQHPQISRLDLALDNLQRVLDREGFDASGISRVRTRLTRATDDLLPKPSDDAGTVRPG